MRSDREHKIFYTVLWIFLLGSLTFFIIYLSMQRLTLPSPLWVMFVLLDAGFIVFIFVPRAGRPPAGPPGGTAERERWYPRGLSDIVEAGDEEPEIAGVREAVRTVQPVPLAPLLLMLVLLVLAAPNVLDEGDWRLKEEQRLTNIFDGAASRLLGLESAARELGMSAARLVDSSRVDLTSPAPRAALVHRLDSLAARVRWGLSPFREVGVQLYSTTGERYAWGGRPRYVREVGGGDYPLRVFTSRTAMYTLLVVGMPLPRGGRVVVDIPLEVNYRINNQFLRSTGLGEILSEQYGTEIGFSFAMGEHRGEMRWADDRLDARKTLATYNASEGVMLHGAIRSSTGLPLAHLRVVGSPYAVVLEKREARRVAWGGLLVTLVAAVIALWVYRRYGKRGRPGTGTAWMLLRRFGMLGAFLFVIRWLMLRLDVPGGLADASLFDPSFFADELPLGLARTTGDLLITGIFALLLVFGVIKIYRTYYPGRLERPLAEGAPGQPGGKAAPTRWIVVAVKAVLLAALVAAAAELSAGFISRVTWNAIPRLVGLDVVYLSFPVIALHLAMLFAVSAILIVVLFLARLVLVHAGRSRREALICSVASLLIYAAALRPHWLPLVAAAALLLLSARAFPLLRKEEIVSIVLASFFLVLISTLLIFDTASGRYEELRESRVVQRAEDFNRPEDTWIAVILAETCQEMAADHRIASRIVSRTESAAFEIWAEGSFSLLNFSCIFDAYDAKGVGFSHFEVGIPFRAPPFTREPGEDPAGNPLVERSRVQTREGTVYYLRGVVPVHSIRGERIGTVVMTVPYFFENTELLARTGPLAPEILQNIERGAQAPRVDEPENLLVARLSEGRVVESSTPLLVAGSPVLAADGVWFTVDLGRERYNCVRQSSGDDGYLVGYRVAGAVERLLAWAAIVSLDVILAALSLVALVLLRRLPFLGSVMPAVSLGGGLGFREKMLLSFLVVSILPVLILGVFSGRFIQRSFEEEKEREAIEGVQEAVSMIDYSIRAEAESFAGSQYLAEILGGARDARVRDVALLESTYFTLIDEDGALLLDERMSDLSSGEIARLIGDEYVDRLTAAFEAPRLYGGVVVPVEVPGGRRGHLYYRRVLDDEFLERIAEVGGTTIDLYFEGLLRASSERGLFIGGFIEPLLASGVFADVALNGSTVAVREAMLGDYSYRVASAPLPSIHRGESGVLSVSMLYQPSLLKREILGWSSLMLGLLAILFAAAVALGVFLAGRIFTPVAALIGGTRRIISGDLEFKLESKAPDEIGELVGSFNAMTGALREARRGLLERQRYLAAVLDNVATGVMTADADGIVITLNPAGERILGIARDRVVGRSPEEVSREGARELFAFCSEGRALSPGGVREREIPLQSGEGRRTIRAIAAGLGEGERRLGMVIVFDDLTELIRSKKLSAWIEMARQIAHEVKNPLTPIRLSAQLMRRAYEEGSERFGEIFRTGVETVIQQTEILRRISSEFSSFGRVARLHPEAVPLGPFLSEFVASYRGVEGTEIVYETGEEISVLADREALRKVLVNIMENALEAMAEGGRITVGYRRDAATARIVIADTGTGLSDEVQEKLFEPYFSTKTNGTGLGLAICRNLIHEMDGEIRLRNRGDGHGVEAVVTLPITE